MTPVSLCVFVCMAGVPIDGSCQAGLDRVTCLPTRLGWQLLNDFVLGAHMCRRQTRSFRLGRFKVLCRDSVLRHARHSIGLPGSCTIRGYSSIDLNIASAMGVEESCAGTPSQQVFLQIDRVIAGNLLCDFDCSF